MIAQHIVLTLGRSGSNTLVDMLNQNPRILNYGEVLGSWTTIGRARRYLPVLRRNDAAFLDALLGRKSLITLANIVRNGGKIRKNHFRDMKRVRDIRSVGVKEFSINLRDGGIHNYLARRPRIKVIGLVRRNSLARMISSEMLFATGIVSVGRDDSVDRHRPKRPRMAPDEALSKLQIVDEERAELERMLDNLPSERVLRFDYEDFFSSQARAVELSLEAQSFLGVPQHPPAVRMRKILARDPLHAIENHEEVRKAIAQSRFAGFLSTG